MKETGQNESSIDEAARDSASGAAGGDGHGDSIDAEGIPEPRRPDSTYGDSSDSADPVDFASPSPRQPDQPSLQDSSWGEEKGALGEDFQSGAYDEASQWSGKENAIAQRLADDGAAVHARTRYETPGVTNPDAMVRRSPEDEGTVTEFKTLESDSPAAISRNISDGGGQVGQHGGGDVVIDGRNVGLTSQQAEAGHYQAQTDKQELGRTNPLPDRVHYLLGGNTIETRNYY